ncbi:MAG: SDR family NAD(P)-dependent oxidoreductase [Thaumarchaeota archaeon]|nr:SDR family NAD(P)-dependent oxidoreductase [Nitrososphaerota archaeon]
MLALNAGIGPKSSWEDVSVFHKIMETNLFGVINGVSTFLPAIQAKATADAPAAVIITGSKQGITNPPGNPAYNASKAAVKTLAEHLSFDTRDNPAIAVHLLVPGWVHTNLTGAPRGAQEKPAGSWWPDQIADFLEQKMAAGQFYVMCPDEDVSEDTDRKRMLWAVGDVNERRPPLSRWRAEWKAKAQEWMDKQKV